MASRDELARLRRYERELAEVYRRLHGLDVAALRRVRRAFSSLVRAVIDQVPETWMLDQAHAQALLAVLGDRLDRLAGELRVEFASGLSARAEAEAAVRAAFGRLLGTQEIAGLQTLAGVTPEKVDAALAYTARLISWREGGLLHDMQRRVDRVLRTAMVGGTGVTRAKAALTDALGDEAYRYANRAETIFRTEVNRFHSIVTDESIRRFADYVPGGLSKRWYWSGISREEHQRIHGQTVPWNSPFRVPTRRHGTIELMFPRAATTARGGLVPGEATINCACFHAPVPTQLAEEITVPVRRPAAA